MEENKNFNELLIEILKQIHVRLDRLDAKIETKADKEDVNALRVMIETKADKEDIGSLKQEVGSVKENVGSLKKEVNSLAQRLDRIEGGITTLRWVIGAQVAIIGVILAIFKAF